jgi:transcriptional regulator
MYVPEAFASEDMGLARTLVESHAFGMLVAGRGDGAFEITHLPFVLDPGEPFGRLRSHVACANPVAAMLERPIPVVAVFMGPHGYVTPRWYEQPHDNVPTWNYDNVPTWNYAAVHVHGTARRIEEESEVRRLLAQLTARYERGPGEPWTPDGLEPARLARLLQGITAFSIEVTRVESKRKLSQNKSDADRAGVIAGLLARGGDGDAVLARWMEEESS